MNVQKRLRELMNERNWSCYRLAKESDLSQSTVANLFDRNNSVSIPVLEIICEGLGISMSQFFIQENEVFAILTPEEKDFLYHWISLTPEQQQALRDLMNLMKPRRKRPVVYLTPDNPKRVSRKKKTNAAADGSLSISDTDAEVK